MLSSLNPERRKTLASNQKKGAVLSRQAAGLQWRCPVTHCPTFPVASRKTMENL
jgi:hypothetical protein